MSKSVIITPKQWVAISRKIADNYPRSVWLIREKMREVLGFTVRDHKEWTDKESQPGDEYWAPSRECITTIHLDFYNEPKRIMFLLRYSEFINKID